ncbi:MAG: Two component regulator containing a CheY-like receiver domain and an DNA-binding domain [Frankiales bacterium]|jgi:two-component system nitrate/nitrite response regulator NarL|nr:Two component regulator containing a CheY-like receiver domain and an DNA-binding domain [Frankiales bacterium]
MSTQPVRVLLVDDHPAFSRGLALLLAAEARERLEVVGQVDDAAQAVATARRVRPDLALVDLSMPEPGGLAAVRALTRELPAVAVLVLSGLLEDEPALEALRAGARGFVPKTSDPASLVSPLLAAADGWALLPPRLLARLVSHGAPRAAGLRAQLDEDQVALWRMVALGHSAEQVATRLYVSERTAKRMVAGLLERLGASTRMEAAALAGRAGLLD